MRTLRIFISSPGDVAEERQIAGKVIERLQGKYWSFVRLDDVFWEQKVVRSTAHYQDELINPGDCEMVVGILWSRLGSPLPEKFRKQTGERYQSGTEWELEVAFDAYEKSLAETGNSVTAKPDIIIYRRKGAPPAREGEELNPRHAGQTEKLDAYLKQNYLFPDGTIKRPITGYTSLEEFERKLALNLEELILRHIPGLKPGFEPPPISGSPFKGLQAFSFRDSDRYFGRNREIREIQQQLVNSARKGMPFLLIYGGSGYGKSSLMRAGLAPVLTRPGGSLDSVAGWRRVSFQPAIGEGPLVERFVRTLLKPTDPDEVKEAQLHPHWPLTGLAELDGKVIEGTEWDQASLIRSLVDDDRRIFAIAAIADILESLNRHLLLEIDQLEELFTTAEFEGSPRATFLKIVGDLCATGRVWTVATMRSEFFPGVAEEPELFLLVGKDRGYILPPPDRQSLREIIRYPALAARLDFERRVEDFEIAGEKARHDYLHDQILADAESSPDALPLLEFTLQQLYEERDQAKNLLTWKSYGAADGLKGSIAKRATEIYSALPSLSQEARHQIFAALVHVDPARGTVTRQRAVLNNLKNQPGAEDFLNSFLDARLLVTDENSNTKEPEIALAHEALISHWDELSIWIKDHCGDLLARQRLAEQAQLWQENGEKKSYLLSEARLAEAERVATSHLFTLSDQESLYLQLSRQRTKTKQRILHGAVVIFALLAAAAGIFGWRSFVEARLAEQARERAEIALQISEREKFRTQMMASAELIRSKDRTAARAMLDSVNPEYRNWGWAILRAQCGFQPIAIREPEDLKLLGFTLPPEVVSQKMPSYEDLGVRSFMDFHLNPSSSGSISALWSDDRQGVIFSNSEIPEILTWIENDDQSYFSSCEFAAVNHDESVGLYRFIVRMSFGQSMIGSIAGTDHLFSDLMQDREEDFIIIAFPMPNLRRWNGWLKTSTNENRDNSIENQFRNLLSHTEGPYDIETQVAALSQPDHPAPQRPKGIFWQNEKVIAHFYHDDFGYEEQIFLTQEIPSKKSMVSVKPFVARMGSMHPLSFAAGNLLSNPLKFSAAKHLNKMSESEAFNYCSGVLLPEQNGDLLAAFGWDGQASLFRLSKMSLLWKSGNDFRGENQFSPDDMHLAVDPSGEQIAVLPFGHAGHLCIIDTSDGSIIATMKCLEGEAKEDLLSSESSQNEVLLRFSPKGTYLALYGWYRTGIGAAVWNAGTGNCLGASFALKERTENRTRSPDFIWVEWDPLEHYAVRQLENGIIQVCSADLSTVFVNLNASKDLPNPPRFPKIDISPDGKQLLIGRRLYSTTDWALEVEFPFDVIPKPHWGKIAIHSDSDVLEVVDLSWWSAISQNKPIPEASVSTQALYNEVVTSMKQNTRNNK